MATQKCITTTTSSRPMWTMTTVTRRTSTSTTCARSEHACTLFSVLCHNHLSHPHWLKSSLESFTFISIPSMMSVSLWVARLLLLRLLPFLPLHALQRLWLRDQQPAQLRQRDLRHLRRYLPQHRFSIKNLALQMEQGNLWNRAQAHTVEEFVPAQHRDTASSNANKFNLTTDEENIDFNIPGVPNSTVKRSHGASVRDLIQKIENHSNRHALQRDLQQSQSFNPFS